MTDPYAPPGALTAPPRGAAATRMIALTIAGFTGLVFAGSYLAGRSVRPTDVERISASSERAAPVRREEEAAPAASATTEPVAAEPSALVTEEPAPIETAAAGADGGASSFADFDLSLLHPDVAAAVLQAREVQARAVDAARRAEAAAQAARDGAPDTAVITYESGDVYEGEVSDSGRHGVGVYTWANPQEDSYAGEFIDDQMNGLGVKRWSDGATYYGDRRLEAREGHGVFAYANGGGYEGAWLSGAPNGYGVVWNPDGSVRAQGLWANNTLVEAWIVPGPNAPAQPADDSAAEPETP